MSDPSNRVFVIAEAGVNHNGRRDLALQLVDAAAAAGADAVKFQTFRAGSLATNAAPKAAYQDRAVGSESQLEMLQRLELSEADHRAIADHASRRGIEFMSSAFDEASLDLVVRLGVVRLKLGSGELTNGPLVLASIRTGLPLVLSSGMATMDEIEATLDLLAFGLLHATGAPTAGDLLDARSSVAGRAALRRSVTMLHCTTEYPAPVDEVNLRALPVMADRLGVTIGYSDHTAGIAVPIAAVALGARMIEKHLTLDRTMPGPDHAASIEPDGLAAMVAAIRVAEASLGVADKIVGPTERRNIPIVRKSLVAARPIATGELFSPENLTVKRPGNGVSPMRYWELLGTPARRAYAADDLIER